MGAVASAAAAAAIAYSPPEQGAQCNQDRWMHRNVFAHLEMSRGVFVEFGARDGLKHSNSLFFERVLGWEGLLIEAGGDDWPKLRQNRRCRLNGHPGCAHAALSDVENHTLFHHECSGGACRHTVEDPRKDGRAKRVQTATLDGMLARRGVEGVDLLCADCEGCEMKALRAFDFARHKPAVVLLERQHKIDGSLNMVQLRELLHDAGYRELHDPAGVRVDDSIFVRGDLAATLPAPCLDHLAPLALRSATGKRPPCPVLAMPAGEACRRPGAWAPEVLAEFR